MDGVFFHWTCWNKVLLGFHSSENAKVGYGWDFNLIKMLEEDTAGSYTVENAKIRYG